MSGRPPPSFPRMPLFGAGALVVLTIAVAALGRTMDAAPAVPAGPAEIERWLRFEDRPDGAVAVSETTSGAGGPGRLVAEIAPGGDGFVRATLRGLARDRKRRGLGPETPFRLARWADGRLVLEDALTGRAVTLNAFGAVNRDAFGRLLAAGPSS